MHTLYARCIFIYPCTVPISSLLLIHLFHGYDKSLNKRKWSHPELRSNTFLLFIYRQIRNDCETIIFSSGTSRREKRGTLSESQPRCTRKSCIHRQDGVSISKRRVDPSFLFETRNTLRSSSFIQLLHLHCHHSATGSSFSVLSVLFAIFLFSVYLFNLHFSSPRSIYSAFFASSFHAHLLHFLFPPARIYIYLRGSRYTDMHQLFAIKYKTLPQ